MLVVGDMTAFLLDLTATNDWQKSNCLRMPGHYRQVARRRAYPSESEVRVFLGVVSRHQRGQHSGTTTI